MGYAVIIFVVLLISSVLMITVATYGIMKDSQTAPLKAENAYADRVTGKAQTSLTILNTCIQPQSGDGRYVDAHGNDLSEIYSFNLTVRNNGSIVLNSSKPTVIYLSRNTSNKTVIYNSSYIGFPTTPRNFWAPQTNTSLNISGIMINTPTTFGDNLGPSTNPWDELRILVVAENGITVIPPTSPTNFTGYVNKVLKTFTYFWNASYDADGIAFYRLYAFEDRDGNPNGTGNCPPTPYYMVNNISANLTSYVFSFSAYPENTRAYLTAVDNLGNEGVPSRNIDCHTNFDPDSPCKNK